MRVLEMFPVIPEPDSTIWFIQLFDKDGNYICSGTAENDTAIYETHKNGYKIAYRRWDPESKTFIYVMPDGVYWRHNEHL